MLNAIFARHKSLNPIALIFQRRDQKVATRSEDAICKCRSSGQSLSHHLEHAIDFHPVVIGLTEPMIGRDAYSVS
jgi:hypothetical protein